MNSVEMTGFASQNQTSWGLQIMNLTWKKQVSTPYWGNQAKFVIATVFVHLHMYKIEQIWE